MIAVCASYAGACSQPGSVSLACVRTAQHPGPIEEAQDRSLHRGKALVHDGRPCDKHQVPSRGYLVEMPTNHLFHQTARPVSLRGFPHPSAGGEPCPAVRQAVFQDDQNTNPVHVRPAFIPDLLESGFVPQAMASLHLVRRLTVNRCRPLRRRAFSTRRPPVVLILTRNPCVFWRFRTFGCHVLFGICPPPETGYTGPGSPGTMSFRLPPQQ